MLLFADLLSPTARGHFPVSQRKYKLFAGELNLIIHSIKVEILYRHIYKI